MSGQLAKVRIVSDGTPHGSHLFVDGHEVQAISVAVYLDAKSLARAVVEIDDVAFEFDGELRTVLGPLGRPRRRWFRRAA